MTSRRANQRWMRTARSLGSMNQIEVTTMLDMRQGLRKQQPTTPCGRIASCSHRVSDWSATPCSRRHVHRHDGGLETPTVGYRESGYPGRYGESETVSY